MKYIKDISIILVVYLLLVVITSVITGSYTFKHSEGLVLVGISCIFLSRLYGKKYTFCSIIFFVLTTSIVYIKIHNNYAVDVGELRKYIAFIVSLFNITVLLSTVIQNNKIRYVFRFIGISITLLPVSVLWAYYLVAGTWFTTDTLLAVLQTNSKEAQEYILSNINLSTVLLCLVLIICIHFYSKKGDISLRYFSKNYYVVYTIISVMCLFCLIKYKNNIITEIPRQAVYTLNQYKDFDKLREARKTALNALVSKNHKNSEGVFILVIGESQNRDHMSAYGYKRETTPWLNKEKNDKNMLLFNKAYSCHVHTVPTLNYALTAKNQYNTINTMNDFSILEVAEAAGFETVWLSNQVKYSAWDTPLTFIAAEANQQKWVNSNIGETTSTDYFDDILVEKFDELKYTQNMLIVVHLMGNHQLYNRRYPSEFTKFRGDGNNNIDDYDNSILYNDYVMSKLLARAKKIPNFQGLIYCSDHADAVDKHLAHDASQFDADMTHIPLYIYLSDSYINAHKSTYEILSKSQNKTFTNDLLFDMVLGVMKLRIKGIYEPENDITSDSYSGDSNRFKTLYGEKGID